MTLSVEHVLYEHQPTMAQVDLEENLVEDEPQITKLRIAKALHDFEGQPLVDFQLESLIEEVTKVFIEFFEKIKVSDGKTERTAVKMAVAKGITGTAILKALKIVGIMGTLTNIAYEDQVDIFDVQLERAKSVE